MLTSSKNRASICGCIFTFVLRFFLKSLSIWCCILLIIREHVRAREFIIKQLDHTFSITSTAWAIIDVSRFWRTTLHPVDLWLLFEPVYVAIMWSFITHSMEDDLSNVVVGERNAAKELFHKNTKHQPHFWVIFTNHFLLGFRRLTFDNHCKNTFSINEEANVLGYSHADDKQSPRY